MLDIETYKSFYRDIIQLTIKVELAKLEDFEGVSECDIDDSLFAINIKLDNAIRAFLVCFGEKIRVKNIQGISFTIKKIITSNLLAEQRNIKDIISSYNTSIREKYPDIETIIPTFIEYDEIGSVYVFSIAGVENSILYYYWEGDDKIITSNHSFTTTIRNLLFYGLLRLVENESLLCSQLNWLNYFKTYNKPLINNKLIGLRNEYCAIMSEIELRENKLIPLHDYEEQFAIFVFEKM